MIRVGHKTLPWREGMTITEALEAAEETYPYPVVRIGTRYVSRPAFDRTRVPDEAELLLIPMIAGG